MMNLYYDDEYVLKVLPKYTHRKRLDSLFWSFVMSMFSRGVVKKKPVRAESLNLKFGPDPEFETEVMTRLSRVGTLLNALDRSKLL